MTIWREIRAGVLTCSDSCFYQGLPDDAGTWLRDRLQEKGCQVVAYAVVPDEEERIATMLEVWVTYKRCDLIITTGGTGLGPRDVTPEATRRVIERVAPNFMEYARWKTGQGQPLAYLSRGIAGVRSRTLILNFPGHPQAVREYWEALEPLLTHGLALLRGKALHPRGPR